MLDLTTDLEGEIIASDDPGLVGEEMTSLVDAGLGNLEGAGKAPSVRAYRDDSQIRFRIGSESKEAAVDATTLIRIAIEVGSATLELDEVLLDALAQMGTITRADRICVFTSDPEKDTFSNSHEWCRDGVAPLIHQSQQIKSESMAWLRDGLDGQEWVCMERSTRKTPQDQWMVSRDISKVLSVGMFQDEALFGFICYDGIDMELCQPGEPMERLKLVSILFMQMILRVRTEKRLRRADELFRLVRHATNDIVYDWDLRTNRVERSEAVASLLGYPEDEQSSSQAWWATLIHPDDAENARGCIERLKANPRLSDQICEYRVRRRDGTYIHVLDRVHMIRGETGEPIRVVGMATDVTERVMSSRRLAESEARLRAVIENVSDVISVVNRDGMIEYESPSALRVLGYEASSLEGRSVFNNVHPEDEDRLREILANGTDGEEAVDFATFRYRHGSGHWLLIEAVAATLSREDESRGVVLVLRDVTERRRVERQIEQSIRLTSLGHLASSLAHEFNNVLMGALPYVDVIRRTTAPDVIENAVEKIESAIGKGKSISDRIIGFARPTDTVIESLELGSWMRNVEIELRELLPPGVSLELAGPDHGVVISADPLALEQVMVNLIVHARESVRGRGRVAVRWNRANANETYSNLVLNPADHAVIEVHDSGRGYSRESLDHIFDPGFSGRGGEGLELGLAVVRQLLSSQGGSVEVESSTSGTSFYLVFRLARRGLREPVAEPAPVADRGRLILLVEDDEIVASGIAAVLQLEGQRVDVVTSGRAATDYLRDNQPDVIILDIGLPDISGVEVFGRIRSRFGVFPIVFSSGHGHRRELEPLLAQPEVEFLQKPYDARTLMETVARVIQAAEEGKEKE